MFETWFRIGSLTTGVVLSAFPSVDSSRVQVGQLLFGGYLSTFPSVYSSHMNRSDSCCVKNAEKMEREENEK